MKQLIELVRLSALTAFSVALYSAHRRTQATQTTQTGSDDHSLKPSRQLVSEGELVLLGIDGTVIAREVNLSRHAPL